MSKIGMRVGAVEQIVDGHMKLYGYGVYLGDFVPEDDNVMILGMSLKEEGIANPKIQLDNGSIVWGCQCYWGSEEKVKEKAEKCLSVEIVPIPTP